MYAHGQCRSCAVYLGVKFSRPFKRQASVARTERLGMTPDTDQLNLDFDIHTSREIQAHQHVDRFRIRIQNVDQPVVGSNFEMFM